MTALRAVRPRDGVGGQVLRARVGLDLDDAPADRPLGGGMDEAAPSRSRATASAGRSNHARVGRGRRFGRAPRSRDEEVGDLARDEGARQEAGGRE